MMSCTNPNRDSMAQSRPKSKHHNASTAALEHHSTCRPQPKLKGTQGDSPAAAMEANFVNFSR